MEYSTKYYFFWTVISLAILGLLGFAFYSYYVQRQARTAGPGQPQREVPWVLPFLYEAPRKQEQPVEVLEAQKTNPELSLMLPQYPAEGMPFVLTDASEHANRGFKALREKRFQEAVQEYKLASELDPRYEPVYRRTEQLVRDIERLGFDAVKNRRVFPGERLTYKQLYKWD